MAAHSEETRTSARMKKSRKRGRNESDAEVKRNRTDRPKRRMLITITTRMEMEEMDRASNTASAAHFAGCFVVNAGVLSYLYDKKQGRQRTFRFHIIR